MTTATKTETTHFVRGLGLFDSVMIVIGVMIGSGIFIVPAEMARNVGSPGWLLVAWAFAGLLTIAAALSYGELASMMPEDGRHVHFPARGFLAHFGLSVWVDAVHCDPDGHHRGRFGSVCALLRAALADHLREQPFDPSRSRFLPATRSLFQRHSSPRSS